MWNYWMIDRGFSDLNPRECGEEECVPGHSYGPYARPFYLIHYVFAGSGKLYAPQGTYELSAGQFFLIRPGEVNTYVASTQDPWHYIWIGFDGTLAARLQALPSPVGELPPTLFRELQKTAREGFAGWENMREEYVVTVIHRLMAALLARSPHAHYARMAENYIRTMYMQDISVERIAAMLSLNRRYLSRLFHRRYGMTMQEYLVRTRLDAAVAFLREGRTVSESAMLSGYRDPLNFSKMFRRYYHCAPRTYAKQMAASPAVPNERKDGAEGKEDARV